MPHMVRCRSLYGASEPLLCALYTHVYRLGIGVAGGDCDSRVWPSGIAGSALKKVTPVPYSRERIRRMKRVVSRVGTGPGGRPGRGDLAAPALPHGGGALERGSEKSG
jgi:hypothetical protein